MKHFFKDKNSSDLILFFSGWGCDENQFTNLIDEQDVLILYDYQNLNLSFDFSKYRHIDLMAYSAGVFVASILQNSLPSLRKKIAICGNPYLFDEELGLSQKNVDIFKNINLDNYLDFRRQYMVTTSDEFEKYNALPSLRTFESCQNELNALQKLYQQNKEKINPNFDKALIAADDLLFNPESQKRFYKEKIQIIPEAKHHIFFKFNSFQEILNFS